MQQLTTGSHFFVMSVFYNNGGDVLGVTGCLCVVLQTRKQNYHPTAAGRGSATRVS